METTYTTPRTTTPAYLNPASHECLYDGFTLWTLGVVGNLINVVGLVGNLLTFFVLLRMSPKTSILVYIIALSFSDITILFFSSLFIYSLRAFGFLESNLNFVNDVNRGYFLLFYLTEVFLYLNTWLTLAMCVDRYVSVCKPHRAGDWCKKTKAVKVVVGLSIAVLIFNIPKALESTSIPDPSNVTDCLITTERPIIANEFYYVFYKTILDLLLRFFFPLAAMIVLTALTILTLRRSNFGALEEGKRKKTKKMTNAITWMCIAVVIVYVVCQVPLIVVYGLEPVFVGDRVFEKIFTTAILLVTLNSSVNFVIYCLLSPNFRRVFFNTLHCRCWRYVRLPLEDDNDESGFTAETSIRSRLSRQFSRTQSMNAADQRLKNERESRTIEAEKIPMRNATPGFEPAKPRIVPVATEDRSLLANRETSV